MSETNPTANTPRVEGELSLDDLSQIAGGTCSDLQLQLDAGALSDTVFKNHDNLSDIQVDTSEYDNLGRAAMNMSLSFP